MARKGQSELRSLGQAEAYPTKSPTFRMWGKLYLAQPGDSPATPAMFFNRAVPRFRGGSSETFLHGCTAIIIAVRTGTDYSHCHPRFTSQAPANLTYNG